MPKYFLFSNKIRQKVIFWEKIALLEIKLDEK